MLKKVDLQSRFGIFLNHCTLLVTIKIIVILPVLELTSDTINYFS